MVMQSRISNREMLLFTNTSFAKTGLGDPDQVARNQAKNSAEQLEKACWSGLIFEMLPGIFDRSEKRDTYVWRVNQAKESIHVAFGNAPCAPDYDTSAN